MSWWGWFPVSSTASQPAAGFEVSAHKIFALALPTLGVLAAMPLYMLLDTAVVGRLGATDLAALGVAATVQSVVTTQLTFLSYGTTARAARFFGAGCRDKAVGEGVQATWVAVIVGLTLMVIMWGCAGSIARALTDDEDVAQGAAAWLRIAALAIPLQLIEMSGNGWMRGVQDTRKPLMFSLRGLIPGAIAVPILVHFFGLAGSAFATVMGMGLIAAQFLYELCVENHQVARGPWRPRWSIMRRQLILGRDLVVRSVAFQIALVSATAVAGSMGTAALAAHQILTQLWNFLSLVLDSLAIAAQALTGAALGSGAGECARRAGVRITGYSAAFALGLAAVFLMGAGVIPRIFTSDAAVLSTIAMPWRIMVVMVVVGGVLFALDGVLLGAADAAYLRTLTLTAVLCGYLPVVWAASAFRWGLSGVWCGLGLFILIRTVGVVVRFYSMAWARSTERRAGCGNSVGGL